MNIRRAEISDLPELVTLFEAYRAFYGKPADPIGTEHFLRERFDAKESVIFVAESERTLVAFIQLYPTFSSLSLLPSWILNDLYVAPGTRRRSVARSLVKFAESFACESRCRGLTLKTAVDNQPARALYESLGWKRDQQFVSYDKLF